MQWIKRNLFFVVGAVVALALMGCAFFYLFVQYSENVKSKDLLGEKYTELKQFSGANPHPGDDKVDNIKLAQEQQKQVDEFVKKTLGYFRPIPPIPNTGAKAIRDAEFASALRTTVEQLRHDASSASVSLATNYYFTFAVQSTNLSFKDGLQGLATQLGEIKAICDIVFAARVNSLDSIRRERVATDDSQGFSDYHDRTTVTNTLALFSPYEVTVQSFSPELGKLLAGFANTTYPILVKQMNIERATSGASMSIAEAPPGGLPQFRPVARGGRRGQSVIIEEEPVIVTLWLDVVKMKSGTK
jgi:hypothetical protein